ncbi:DUF5103 domain-containing protein [Flavobacterium sp. HSC-61S13]|uniref:type IX secretion system plug protein n=1 Tax=Flavobacterium sp. HSC-61S13 TaxID=2910963 RepID=UPI00209CFCD2|nr:DUF5103 domain-containing protein [Flavobacterium sp. HSC-61S13]MCP1995429.1 hypothetical protein [Flavobacterium sp. HSC-61S13]
MLYSKIKISLLALIVFSIQAQGQNNIQEKTSNYIKSAAFMKNNQAVVPFFRLGTSINFEFDDLLAGESDYYYNITQYNYDWSPSQLSKIDYLDGMDDQRIASYANSFNTLQLYSHYNLTIPNSKYNILKSGNYVLEITNRSEEVMIRRKFIVYEELVNVPVVIKRSRDLGTFTTKQNVDFTIKLGEQTYQNPVQNIKVYIFQNGQWATSISRIKPQYTIGTDLIYKYNKETQFWGGNEFLNFDNKDIRGNNNMIGQVTADEIYNTHLYPNLPRANKPYTFFPDINGSFYPRNINRDNASIEADYTWIYFTLVSPEAFGKKQIYITGMFNNYEFTSDNLMSYNAETQAYEKALLIKQGFTNFQYTTVNNQRIDLEDPIDGNFAETENQYQVLVYYRGNNDLYDRVIGIGEGNSENIIY